MMPRDHVARAVAKRRPEHRQVVRHEEGRDRGRDDVVEHLAPAGDEADHLVEGVAGEARRPPGLRVHHRRLDVGGGGEGEDQPGDQERDRGQAEREARHHPERVVDRRADVPVGGREQRPDAVHAAQRLFPGDPLSHLTATIGRAQAAPRALLRRAARGPRETDSGAGQPQSASASSSSSRRSSSTRPAPSLPADRQAPERRACRPAPPGRRGPAPSPRRFPASPRRPSAPRPGLQPPRPPRRPRRRWPRRRRAGGRRGWRRSPRPRPDARGQHRVLGRHHSLDEHGQARVRDQRLEVRPAERRIDQAEDLGDADRPARPRSPRRRSARRARPAAGSRSAGRAPAAPGAGRRRSARSARNPASTASASSALVTPAVAEAVELEPEPRLGRRGRHLARSRRGEGREAHHRPRARRRPRHPGLAVRVRKPLEGDRGDQDRHRQPARRAPSCGCSTSADVDQHPRPQPPARERRHVLAQRPLVPRPAGEVPVRARARAPPRPGARSRRR